MGRTLRRSEQGKKDHAFLEQVVNHPAIQDTDTNSGQEPDQNDLETMVDDSSVEKTAAQKRTEEIQEDVEDQKTKDKSSDEQDKDTAAAAAQREHDKYLKDQKAAADKKAQQLKARSTAGDLMDKAGSALDQPIKAVGRAADQVQTASTPGGIGFLVLLLLFLLFVIVKVNQKGDTRIKQFWYMLSGKAHLDSSLLPAGVGTVQNDTGSTASSGSSGQTPAQDAQSMIQNIGTWIENVVGNGVMGNYAPPDSFRVGGP